MTDLLPEYLQHLDARVRPRRGERPTLPAGVTELCSKQPRECLTFVLRALDATEAPDKIEAIGNELIDNLLNESSGRLGGEVSDLLRDNRKFRQSFACAKLSSVDPAVMAEWVDVLQSMHTTKEAERKSLRRMRRA